MKQSPIRFAFALGTTLLSALVPASVHAGSEVSAAAPAETPVHAVSGKIEGIQWDAKGGSISDQSDNLPPGAYIVFKGSYSRKDWTMIRQLTYTQTPGDKIVFSGDDDFKVYTRFIGPKASFGIAVVGPNGEVERQVFTFPTPQLSHDQMICSIPAEFLGDPFTFSGPEVQVRPYCDQDPLEDLSIKDTGVLAGRGPTAVANVLGRFPKKKWRLYVEGKEVLISPNSEFTLGLQPPSPISRIDFLAVGPNKEQIQKVFIVYVPTKAVSITEINKLGRRPWLFAGVSVGSPTGFGASWGDVFGGVYYNPVDRIFKADGTSGLGSGSLGLGFGVGNSTKSVALETVMSVTSIYPHYPNSLGSLFTTMPNFNTGGFSFKLHRDLADGLGVAVGAESLVHWGGADLVASPFAAVTKAFFLRQPDEWFSSLVLNGGFGNGRWSSLTDLLANHRTWNIFASAAVRLREPVNLIVDWESNTLDLAVSVTPFRATGLYLSSGLTDLAGSLSFGARLFFTVGYSYTFH